MFSPHSHFLKKALLLFSFLFIAFYSSAQDSLSAAWNEFLNNKPVEAKTKFTAALTSPQKAEALLGLALISEYDKSQGDAFNYFRQFYAEKADVAPYLVALWSTQVMNQGRSKKSPDALEFFNQLTLRKDIDGSLVAKANSVVGKHYELINQVAKAEKNLVKIGSINDWQITGEFENISTSGFDKTYETLTQPSSDAVFTNKFGAPVKWFVPPHYRRDRWYDFTYYFESVNSIVFAQTFVYSPSEREVQLRIGVSGSIKTWLNDQLVLSEAEERNNDLDTYIRKVKLHQGYNRILIQIGESYAGRSNFLARITDDNGTPVEGLTYSPNLQKYEKENIYEPKTVTLFAEDYFRKQIDLFPDNPVNYILLAKTYMHSDKVFETRHVMEQLKKRYPNSTYVNIIMIELFYRSDDRTGAESTKETIKMNDPGHPFSLELLYNAEVEKTNYTEAEKYVDKLETLMGKDSEEMIEKRLALSGYNKKQSEMIKIANDGYKKYPDNVTFVTYKYIIENSIKQNLSGAISVLKKYLESNTNWEMTRSLIKLYFDSGNLAMGIKLYQEAIEKDPVGVGYYNQLAQIYYQMQDYQKAEESINKALTIAPYIYSYHASLAKIYNAQKKTEQAINQYKVALMYYPNDYLSIQELRKLENKKDIYDYFPKPDVMSIIKSAPVASAYPEDNSIILNENVQTIIYPNGGSEEKHFMVVKIFNNNGLEKWKEMSVEVKPWQNYLIETAEVVKANGNKVPAEQNNNEMVFTNLEVGDCIVMEYKLYSYSKGKLANKYWNTFYFSHAFPYVKTTYSVLVAKNQPFQYKFSLKDIEPNKTSVDEFDLYTWTQENQASLKYEDKMPPMFDVSNVLHMSTIPSWSFVSNWYYDLATAKARPSYEVKEAVAEVLKGKEKATDREKVELIYYYITQKITYSSVSFRQSGLVPQKPSTVLNTRIGDCKDVATLFVSMCKEANITAQLVLVNTHDYGMKSIMLPSIDFNHCIARLVLDNKEYYIELTSNYLPFSSFDLSSMDAIILDINNNPTGDTIKYLRPATRIPNISSRKTTVKIEDKDMVVNEHNVKVGATTANMRFKYLDVSEKDRIKYMEEVIQQLYPSVKVNKLSFKNLENSNNRDTLYTTIDYRLKDDVKTIGGITILSFPWSNKAVASDFTVDTPRYFALDLGLIYAYEKESETITFEIPEGKTIIENLEPVNLSNEFIDYEMNYKLQDKKITYTRVFKLKKTLVPADQLLAFDDFYKKIIAQDNKQIALK